MTRRDPAQRRAQAGCLILLVLHLGGCLAGPGNAQGHADPEVPGMDALQACSAGTAERRPLVLPDGLHAYVEPSNLLNVGGDHVVVGAPTYTWRLGDGRAEMASEREHIAAYLDGPRTRLVDKPLEIALQGTGVRAVPLGGRTWGVILPETEPDSIQSFAGPLAVWYVEYDGERWSRPEALPLTPGQRLFVGSSSSLVAHDGALAWAVLDRESGAVRLYERVAGRWDHAPVPDSDVEAVALGSGGSGMWLALSGLDPGVSERFKSVRLYHRGDDGWRLVTRDPTTEPYTEIGGLHLMVSAQGVTVGWSELRGQGVAYARVGVALDEPGELVVLDEAAAVVRHWATASGEPAWVVQHNDTVRGEAELRVVRLDGPRARPVTAIPLPFTGFFAAHAAGPDEVLVTGAEFDPDPARATVRSLTLRLKASCQ